MTGEPIEANAAVWDGTEWHSMGPGTNEKVEALTVFDDGSGPDLYAGGWFTTAGGNSAAYVARWENSTWSALGLGLNHRVFEQVVFDDGSGEKLYVGGNFTEAGGLPARSMARWDGSSWSSIGAQMNSWVDELAIFDDGSGPALYAGGDFTEAGGMSGINRIAKWDGTNWFPLGQGMEARVNALAVFDDGSGPALYAGGHFLSAGGVTVNGVAKWDGSSWSPLGSGLLVQPGDRIWALTVFDDGSGEKLYAGGQWSGGFRSIARWDGTTWSQLTGTGTGGIAFSGQIRTLQVLDDGSGLYLYAGGNFDTVNGQDAKHVARWDGATWSRVGQGLGLTNTIGVASDSVRSLVVFDDGSGPSLYAGGAFVKKFAFNARFIARFGVPIPVVTGQPADLRVEIGQPAVIAFDGYSATNQLDVQWRRNGQNLIEDPPRVTGTRTTTLSIDQTQLADSGLYDAVLMNSCGSTTTISSHLTVICYPDCDESTGVGVLDIFDFLCFQDSFVASEPYACDCDTTTGPLVCDIFDFLCFQDAFVAGCP